MRHQETPYIVPVCEEQIEILYQDAHLLLIDKPCMLLSTPGKHPLNRDSVITRLRQQFPQAELAHRLDMDTSGIMIIPLHKQAHRHISMQFQNRQVDKTYTAILYGQLQSQSGEINLPMICDWERRPLQKICFTHGKPALTRYEVVERNTENNTSRVIYTPITGRSHQLRLHSQAIGHPILGCDMYAHDTAYAMAKRLLLHATWIRFTHPLSGKTIEGKSPVPF